MKIGINAFLSGRRQHRYFDRQKIVQTRLNLDIGSCDTSTVAYKLVDLLDKVGFYGKAGKQADSLVQFKYAYV